MRTLTFAMMALGIVSIFSPASAGPRDPWFLGYVVSGGNIVQFIGPFSSENRCYARKNRIPRGTEFVGCFQ